MSSKHYFEYVHEDFRNNKTCKQMDGTWIGHFDCHKQKGLVDIDDILPGIGQKRPHIINCSLEDDGNCLVFKECWILKKRYNKLFLLVCCLYNIVVNL